MVLLAAGPARSASLVPTGGPLAALARPEADGIAAPTPAPLGRATYAAGPAQFRAYWVDAFGDGIYTQAQIDQLVADAKAANLNAIVAQVVRRGDCFCNKAGLPRTEAPIAPLPFDPLQSLIDSAHAQGIEVHAWVIAMGMWQGATPPADPSHIFNQHGPAASGQANWIDYRSDGADSLGNEFFLDPGNPDAAAWVVSVATAIARSYAVDGLNLDRIRYPDGHLGALVPSWPTTRPPSRGFSRRPAGPTDPSRPIRSGPSGGATK